MALRILTRAQWNARPPTVVSSRPLSEVVGICFHHSVTPQPSDNLPGTAIARMIQREHMDGRGYSDIAYNALVGPSGRIYEGRAITSIGAHSDGTYNGFSANHNLLSICFIGNYEQDRLTLEAKQAAQALAFLWAHQIGRKPIYVCHSDTKPTACPGNNVRKWVRTL